jgi:hypothetical protein
MRSGPRRGRGQSPTTDWAQISQLQEKEIEEWRLEKRVETDSTLDLFIYLFIFLWKTTDEKKNTIHPDSFPC